MNEKRKHGIPYRSLSGAVLLLLLLGAFEEHSAGEDEELHHRGKSPSVKTGPSSPRGAHICPALHRRRSDRHDIGDLAREIAKTFNEVSVILEIGAGFQLRDEE
ncbi:hypothetical protein C8R46DRAFT_1203065 [Mycena filopes]|nr:hypothetical protein C8R46DRAFT_1203065 [Mycena filopes]